MHDEYLVGDEVECRVVYAKGPARFFVRDVSSLSYNLYKYLLIVVNEFCNESLIQFL